MDGDRHLIELVKIRVRVGGKHLVEIVKVRVVTHKAHVQPCRAISECLLFLLSYTMYMLVGGWL